MYNNPNLKDLSKKQISKQKTNFFIFACAILNKKLFSYGLMLVRAFQDTLMNLDNPNLKDLSK